MAYKGGEEGGGAPHCLKPEFSLPKNIRFGVVSENVLLDYGSADRIEISIRFGRHAERKEEEEKKSTRPPGTCRRNDNVAVGNVFDLFVSEKKNGRLVK